MKKLYIRIRIVYSMEETDTLIDKSSSENPIRMCNRCKIKSNQYKILKHLTDEPTVIICTGCLKNEIICFRCDRLLTFIVHSHDKNVHICNSCADEAKLTCLLAGGCF